MTATEYGPITEHLSYVCEQHAVANPPPNQPTSSPLVGKVDVRQLDWFSESDAAALAALPPYDVVLVSDCTLNAKEVPTLVGVIKKFHDLSKRGTGKGAAVYVGLCRERDGTQLFLDMCDDMCDAVDFVEYQHPLFESRRFVVVDLKFKEEA